jgi:capsular exopolysaccharide synthesis family protein
MNEVYEIKDPLYPEDNMLEEYWRIVKRRWHLVALVCLVFLAVAVVKEFRKIPQYRASGTLLIERESSNLLMFNDSFSFSDGWRNEYLNTQVRILRSRRLIQSVLEDLKLFVKKKNQNEENSNPPRVAVSELRVIPIPDTRLVEVSYNSPDPELAALAVNTLFEHFIRFNLRLKTESTKEASEFLSKQINELRKTLTQKERELQEYGKRKELFYLSSKDTTVVDKFGDLNKAYTEAQIHRINMESIYRELKDKNFDEYPEVRKNTLIQNFKHEFTKLESDYKKKSEIFRESYPEMKRLKTQLDNLRRRIRQETLDIGRKALNEAQANYQSALKKENSLQNLLNEQKTEVISTNTNAIYYNSLKIEVENMRNLLDHLVKKQKESLLTSRLEGLQTSNIKVIDPAEIPEYPISSNTKKLLLMTLMMGLFAGAGLVFGLEWLDQTIKAPEEVERYLRKPSLGFVPALGTEDNLQYQYAYSERNQARPMRELKSIELANYVDAESSIAESYRTIRTSILLSTPESPPKIITVSSSVPKEGKTSTVVNLAISFTKLSKKVLIIDGDLRKPSLHKIFRIKNTQGLSSFLVSKSNVEEVFFKTDVNNLYVIPSGPIPPNPSELLDSQRMSLLLKKMKEHFDVIFIDSPPLIGIVDPVIIGRHSDGTIMVIWAGKTQKRAVQKAKEELDRYRIRILGVVLNKVNLKKNNGYGYYSYQNYNYAYSYGHQDATPKPGGNNFKGKGGPGKSNSKRPTSSKGSPSVAKTFYKRS